MLEQQTDSLPRNAFDSAAVGMAVIDPDTGHFLRVNASLQRILRRTEAELLAMPHDSMVDPADLADSQERGRKLLAGEIDTWQVEKVMEAGDGTPRWVRSSGSLIHDAGRPLIFVQYQDLSERREAEEALHHTDVRLHSAISNAPIIVFTLDTEGRVTFVEGGALDDMPPPKAGFGQSVFEAYADQPEIERNIRRALAGERFEAVLEVRGIAFDTRYAPLTDDRGEVVGVVGAAIDATRRVEAAREVERSEQRQSALARLGDAALEHEGHQAVLELAVSSVAVSLGVETCAILELNGSTSGLTLRAGQGWQDDGPVEGAVFERVLDTGGTEVVAEDPGRYLAVACIGLPEGPAGVLAVGSGRELDAIELEFLEAVAHTVASSAARRRHEEEMRRRSLHDALTGLGNRTLLADRIEQALATARRAGSEVALLLLDLDDFKDINDTLGHETGDFVLRVLSTRLAQALRESDTVARLGGDEFAAVVTLDDGRDGAAGVAHKLLEVVDEPIEVGGSRLHLAASVGVALSSGAPEDTSSLLRQADVAMYQAKRAGGGLAFYDPSREATSMRYLAAAGQLREGIERGELVLHYQPCVKLDSDTALGVEALVRWQHPELGLLPPDRFIPLAERTALIDPLTEWVLTEALAERERLAEAGWELNVAVNVSSRSLEHEGLEALVRRALTSSGTDPSWLELEITETGVVGDHQRVNANMAGLLTEGVRFGLDDFGTGQSSLSQLERLDVQVVKVDRSFTARLGDPRATGLMRSIVDLLNQLGVVVVAEGVETEDQRRCLADLGCELGQGFHLARPMPADELRRWLEQRS